MPVSTRSESQPRPAAPAMSVSRRSPIRSGRPPPRVRGGQEQGRIRLADHLPRTPVVVSIAASSAPAPGHFVPSAAGTRRRGSSPRASHRAGRGRRRRAASSSRRCGPTRRPRRRRYPVPPGHLDAGLRQRVDHADLADHERPADPSLGEHRSRRRGRRLDFAGVSVDPHRTQSLCYPLGGTTGVVRDERDALAERPQALGEQLGRTRHGVRPSIRHPVESNRNAS